jgi:hypothetical protein
MICPLHNKSVLEIWKDLHPLHYEWNLLAEGKRKPYKGSFEIPIQKARKKNITKLMLKLISFSTYFP